MLLAVFPAAELQQQVEVLLSVGAHDSLTSLLHCLLVCTVTANLLAWSLPHMLYIYLAATALPPLPM